MSDHTENIYHHVNMFGSLVKVQFLNGIWNPKARPFEIQTNVCHFVKSQLKSGQKHPGFKWSCFQMVGTIALQIGPFEIWSSKSPNFECVWIFMVRLQISIVPSSNRMVQSYPLVIWFVNWMAIQLPAWHSVTSLPFSYQPAIQLPAIQ